jgi:hypothetical protein
VKLRSSVLNGAAIVFLYNRLMAHGRDHESSEGEVDVAAALHACVDLDIRERAVLDWRIEGLLRAGFDELRACTIAAVGDWRLAIKLVEDGCEHNVAADIVLP